MPADSDDLLSCSVSDFARQTILHTGKQVQVTRAVRLKDQLPVVLKALLPQAQTPSAVARMRYEYRVLMQVQSAAHPQLPAPVGLVEEHTTVAIAMEDVGGTSVRSLLIPQRLELSTALHVGLQVAQAVGHLHRRQVMHRDINPNNVIFNPQDRRVQLIDFDLASLLRQEAQAATDVRALEGTLESMSPEQTGRMDRSIDYRTDFYSLGTLLYELLSGRPVFALADCAGDPDALLYAILAKEPTPLQQLVPDVPPMLAAVVHRLLAKVPEERYTSAHGVVADLEGCAAQLVSGRRESFALGVHDRDEQLRAPQKLYGRDDELARLWDA